MRIKRSELYPPPQTSANYSLELGIAASVGIVFRVAGVVCRVTGVIFRAAGPSSRPKPRYVCDRLCAYVLEYMYVCVHACV